MRSSRRFKLTALIGCSLVGVAACGASPAVQQSIAAKQAAALTSAAGSSTVVGGGAATNAPVVPLPGQAPAGSIATSGPTDVTSTSTGGPVSSGTQATTAPLASGACGAAAPAGGNGGSTDEGVTATTIKVGGTYFNGGYLDKYSQVAENAARAYFSYINDQGGICGRKIEYDTCDTAGTADGTSGCLTKLADQDKVFIMGPSLDFNLDIVEKGLAQRKLPWVGSSGLYQEEFESPWMYPTQPPGGAVGALISTYAVTKLGSKRIGVSLLRDAAGPSCTAEAKSIAAKNGAAVVATATNDEEETTLDSEVGTLKNAKVDTVLLCNDPVNTIKFIQAAQRVGWKPKFVGGFVAADDVPEASGTDAKGMYGLTLYDFYNANTPGVNKYKQITQYYYPNTFHHFYEQATYVGAEAIVSALQAMGPDVTRTGFVKQLRSMTNYDSGLGLKLDFANLGGQTPSGEMLQADDNLTWHQITSRFSPAS